MDPGEEGHHGPGEEDDEGPSAPFLPPDDRLWRHPSEVRSNPPTPAQTVPGGLRGWFQRGDAGHWLVGVTSGVLGALVCAGILIAAGAVGRGSPTVTDAANTSGGDFVTSTTSRPSNPSPPAIYDSVEPSVVGVTVNADSGVESGSGVVVYSNGPSCYVLTDSSFFSGSTSSTPVQVGSYLGEVVKGTLVGTDPSDGIAVVKADLCARKGRYPAISPAQPGSVADVETGEQVFCIGSSAVAATANGSDFTSGYMDDATSYLAPVNGGSNAMFSMLVANVSVDTPAYGGPLVDGTGALIGITNQVVGPAQPGLIYVTPIDTAMEDVTSIIKTGQAAAHAWLGLLQETDISAPAAQGLKVPGGIEVQSLSSGSPAAKAGIAPNDVITAIDGSNGNVSSVGAFVAWMALAKPGEVVNIRWLHDGQPHHAHLTLGKQPAVASPS